MASKLTFRCEVCNAEMEMVSSLQSHYRRVHNMQPPDSAYGHQENRKPCPFGCGGMFSRIDKHKNSCKMAPPPVSPPKDMPRAKRTNTARPAPAGRPIAGSLHRDSPSNSMMGLSLSDNTSLGNQSGNMTPAVLGKIVDFMNSERGGKLEAKTVALYKGKLGQFFKFIENKYGPNAPWQIISVSWAEHMKYLPLPEPGQFVEAIFPNEKETTSSRLAFFNAYKKLCDYLLYKLGEALIEDLFDHQRRERYIERQRQIAFDMDQALSKKANLYREERLNDQRTLEDQEPEVPDEVIKHILNDYEKCAKRAKIFEALELEMKPVEGLLYAEENVRDFLILELYIQGVGMRPDVLQNLTLHHLTFSQMNENGDKHIVEVGKHKTGKTYGSMKIFIPKRLFKLVINFCTEMYPSAFKRHLLKAAKTDKEKHDASVMQPNDHVFVSNRGSPLDSIQRSMDLWKKFVPDSFGDWRVTPYDFRRYCETQYQSSDNPLTRENAPAMIGHSQAIAKSKYVQRSDKLRRNESMREEVLGTSDPILNVSHAQDQGFEDQLNDLRTAQKASRKEEKDSATLAKKDAAFVSTARHKLTEGERFLLKQTFDTLGKDTLTLADVNKALEEHPRFEELFNNVKERHGVDDKATKKTIMESYRSMKRNANSKRKKPMN